MVLYPGEDKSGHILHLLDEKRKEGDMCDVQIKISGTKTIHAHKALLAACSPYFESMFMSTFMEATSDEVDLSNMADNSDVLDGILNTFYGHRFEVTEDNVAETLNVATMFLMEDLKSVCETVLGSIITLKNAAEIFVMSLNYDLKLLVEKVLPTIQSRFHDYIIFKDDLLELQTEHMSFLLSNIDLKFVAAKGRFLEMLLKWFVFSDNDDRANLLIGLLQNLQFDVTPPMYKVLDEPVKDIVYHLDDVNKDMSDEVADRLRHVLIVLKPPGYEDYLVNGPAPPAPLKALAAKTGQRASRQVPVPEPAPEVQQGDGTAEVSVKGKGKGSKTDKKKEKKEKKKGEDAEKDGKPGLVNRLLGFQVTTRARDRSPVKERKWTVRTPEQQLELDQSTEGVIILMPSLALLENKPRDAPPKPIDEISGDTPPPVGPSERDLIDVCVYVPEKCTWYRLCTIDADKMPREGRGSTPEMDLMEMEEMMMHGDMDEYEMMMMMDMPRRYRRHMMEAGHMRHMPPSMSRRMMRDMEMDDDLPPHASMMMRAMSRRHRFPPDAIRRTSVPLVTGLGQQEKWRMVYLRRMLYFFNQDLAETAFCYDIVRQTWTQSSFDASNDYLSPEEREKKKQQRRSVSREPVFPIVDGVEPIVVLDTLYAVVRIKEVVSKDSIRHEREFKMEKVVEVYHKLFRLKTDDTWEFVLQTPSESDRFLQPMPKNERDHFLPSMPTSRQIGKYQTVLYVENDDTLYVFVMVWNTEEYSESEAFRFKHTWKVMLDRNECESMYTDNNHLLYNRRPQPVLIEENLYFIADNNKVRGAFMLAPEKMNNRWDNAGRDTPEKQKYENALKKYPLCPRLILGNGKKVWVLKGQTNDVTELKEMTVAITPMRMEKDRYYQAEYVSSFNKHCPPSFRTFIFGSCGMLDRELINTLTPITRYMHC